MCPICAKKPASRSTVFCDDHLKVWVGSPERYAVDWASEDSYEAEQAQFVDRVRKEMGPGIFVGSALTFLPIEIVVPTGSDSLPVTRSDSGQTNV
jgi:hypothetical protein